MSPESQRAFYLRELQEAQDVEAYLLTHSGLPGPRGNLELAWTYADIAEPQRLLRMAELTAEMAPENTPAGYLAVCGVVGLGRLLCEGQFEVLDLLRRRAQDSRWRIREAVAMALQRWGRADFQAMLAELETWTQGSLLRRRAVVAAICEPALLNLPAASSAALRLLDIITASLEVEADRRSDDFRTLRQALGYGWSVAFAADPIEGQRRMERWLADQDPDVRWVMRQNLRKNRLARLAPDWAARWLDRLGSP
jgi:hypothetical protein